MLANHSKHKRNNKILTKETQRNSKRDFKQKLSSQSKRMLPKKGLKRLEGKVGKNTFFQEDTFFWVLLTTGVLLRLAWAFFPTYPETDFMWYHVKAIELANGEGFLNGIYPGYEGVNGQPTAFRPIGYPLLLSMLYFFTGPSIFLGKMLNIVLSCISLVLLYKLAKRFYAKAIARIALAVFAIFPLPIIYTGILGSETLFTTLLLTCAYFLLVKQNFYWVGLFAGFVSIVRPIGIFFLPCVLFVMIQDKGVKVSRKILNGFIITACFMVVVLPWILRNNIVFGEPVYSTNGGYVAYVNNNPYATGSWSDPYGYPNSPFLKYRYENGFNELEMHKEGKALALAWIKENPMDFLKMSWLRVANTYWLKLEDIKWGFTLLGPDAWHPFYTTAIKFQEALYRPFHVLVFFALGVQLCRMWYRKLNMLDIYAGVIFLYFNAMIVLLEGNSRYLFPLFPFFAFWVASVLYRFPYRMLFHRLVKA